MKDSQLKPTNMLESPSQYEFTQQLEAFPTVDYKSQHPNILLFKQQFLKGKEGLTDFNVLHEFFSISYNFGNLQNEHRHTCLESV